MRAIIVSAIAVAAVVACSSKDYGTNPGGDGPSNADITISNFAFSPAIVTVSPGDTVTVKNNDSAAHTVTHDASPRAFDTGTISSGGTASFVAPSTAGDYLYYCTLHPTMRGILRVQ